VIVQAWVYVHVISAVEIFFNHREEFTYRQLYNLQAMNIYIYQSVNLQFEILSKWSRNWHPSCNRARKLATKPIYKKQ
jgi:hypothetical protein